MGTIKMDLRGIGWGGMNNTELNRDRNLWRAAVNTIMNLWVPQNVREILE
jgi:hypothetical protein